MKLLEELIVKKEAELKAVNDKVTDVKTKFLAKKDLQDNYAEQIKLSEDTEVAKVRIQFLNVQVKLLEDTV